MTQYRINQKFHAVPPPSAGDVPSDRAVQAAEMFGIGLDETYEVTLFDGLALEVRPGDVVLVTGPSGSGKTVLLRRLVEAIASAEPGAHLVDLATVDPPGDLAVIDGLPCPFQEALEHLSSAGLADAFLLLRRPGELSDGQRWRLRLAHALARACAAAEGGGGAGAPVLIADEFCSTLDRLAARAIAYRVRRLATRHALTVLAATAHDDLAEDLAPDVLIAKHEGPGVEVAYRDAARGRPRDPHAGRTPAESEE